MPFDSGDIAVIGLLIFLEGILSIDNAVVLAILAQRLPREKQRKALTYGLVGAVVFRLIAVGLASYLMRMNWVKFVGGGYLLYVGVTHLLSKTADHDEEEMAKRRAKTSFWGTVISIELTDIAFAVDSILAAMAVTQKFWVVFTGGILGVVLMRFAAGGFIKLLRRFPGFELSAYLLVLVIGLKLVIDGFKIEGVDFHHSNNAAFWIFWGSMLVSILVGFTKRGSKSTTQT